MRPKPLFNVMVYEPVRFNGTMLALPLSRLELEDVRHRLDIPLGGTAMVFVSNSRFPVLSKQMQHQGYNLFALNAFAERVMALTEDEFLGYLPLVQMEKEIPSLDRLNQLLFNIREATTLREVNSIASLGRFYFDHDFLGKAFENLPDAVVEKLDFAAIGEEMHQGDGGVLHEQGYTLLIGWPELPNEGVPLPSSVLTLPEYAVELSLEDGYGVTKWRMPCDMGQLYQTHRKGLDRLHIAEVDCLLPLERRFWAGRTTLEEFNEFAKCLLRHQADGTLSLYKAAIDSHQITHLAQALLLSSEIDEFQLIETVRLPTEYAKLQLADRLMPEEVNALGSLFDMGKAMMSAKNLVYTPYGLIGRKDGQPIMSMEDIQAADVPAASEMTME